MPSNGPFYQSGVYVAEITAQALSKASTGTTQFVLRFKVLGTPSEDGSFFPDAHKYERTIYMAITEKTIPYVTETLEALGYGAGGFGPLDPSHSNHESFVGNQIDVYCKHEPDKNGDLRERWQVSRPNAGIKVIPLEAKEVRELDALFGKSLKGKTKSSPQPAVAVMDSMVITDDDIPF